MSKNEISGGARTFYNGSEEDWEPTQKFVEAWYNKNKPELPRCYVLVRDVNYATDPKIDGVWTAHYEISTIFGITQYKDIGGGVVFT